MEINKSQLNFLYKILYQFKFLEIPPFEDYDKLVYSPIYGEVFEDVKKQLEAFVKSDSIDGKVDVKFSIEDFPIEKNRIINLIKAYRDSHLLTDIEKNELLSAVLLPFEISENGKADLLRLFN